MQAPKKIAHPRRLDYLVTLGHAYVTMSGSRADMRLINELARAADHPDFALPRIQSLSAYVSKALHRDN